VSFLLQYARFGAVGLSATAIHVLMFTALIEVVGLEAIPANFAAFGIAVLVSFVGHLHWTFRGETGVHRWQKQGPALARFAVVALMGFALNSLVVYLVVNFMALPYQYAIVVMVGVVPLLVFALSKFWAFA
jgi:putative flippase GtrA